MKKATGFRCACIVTPRCVHTMTNTPSGQKRASIMLCNSAGQVSVELCLRWETAAQLGMQQWPIVLGARDNERQPEKSHCGAAVKCSSFTARMFHFVVVETNH
jgi:hypothetical protein